MKKLVLLLLASVVFIGVGDPSITLTDGSYLMSTGEQAVLWSAPTLTANTLAVYSGAGTFNLVPESKAAEPGKRYVSVWVIDQDEIVPLNKSILYEEKMIFTDKTPDEIKAGIPLLDLINKHNAYRETLKDKDGKVLKKVRLRDIQVVIRNW